MNKEYKKVASALTAGNMLATAMLLFHSHHCAALSSVRLCDPMACSPLRLLYPWGFSTQEYWSRLPCLSPRDLPNLGTEPRSPALQTDSLPTEPPRKPTISQLLDCNLRHSNQI